MVFSKHCADGNSVKNTCPNFAATLQSRQPKINFSPNPR